MQQHEIYIIKEGDGSIQWSAIGHLYTERAGQVLNFSYKFREGSAWWTFTSPVDVNRLLKDIIDADMQQRTTVIDIMNYLTPSIESAK